MSGSWSLSGQGRGLADPGNGFLGRDAGAGDCGFERPFELGEAEWLHEVGDWIEAPRARRGRVDARADDRDVLARQTQHLRAGQSAGVGRFDQQHVGLARVESAARAGRVDRLVTEPGDHVPKKLSHLLVRLADKDPCHARIIRVGEANLGGIRYERRMKRARILVVDDDADIRGLVRELLERRDYEVGEAGNGREGLRAFYAAPPDAVVLDVTMPELDGWQTLERIRDLSDVPVLMLTARGAELEKVRGLKAGADDYLTKPFGRQELLARIEALLRRTRSRAGAPETYADGLLTVDFAQREVTVDGRDVYLTPLEFKLLSALVRHPNQVLSHDQLLELVWGDAVSSSRDQVKLYVGYLRRKLESAGAASNAIETVRGFGYRYRPSAA
jgi:DNA-binding response OmpR family regulator